MAKIMTDVVDAFLEVADVNSYAEWYIEAYTPVTIYDYWKEALD